MSITTAGSTTLQFLEPAWAAGPPRREPPPDVARTSGGHDRHGNQDALGMLPKARTAATNMGVSDDQIRAVVDEPAEFAPDPKHAQRMLLRGNGLELTVGSDGMILRVARRRR